jgi:predicted transposase/invertase (TIGR01784 family)
MVFMKAAYKNDMEAIMEIFNFWHDRGFIENKDVILFFLSYISHTHELSQDKLKKMLDDSKIGGGEIMRTLAQQMKEEFMQTLGPQLKDEGKKEGKREGKEETAKELIKRGVDMDIIEAATGLSREELKKIAAIAK